MIINCNWAELSLDNLYAGLLALLFTNLCLNQVATLTNHVDAQTQVLRKLEEKERFMQNSLATAEKELNLRQQAMEMHKRKAIESAQSAADLKLHLGKLCININVSYAYISKSDLMNSCFLHPH
jgi:sensor c-di-GMP phosphodiesterase-like protein